MGTVAGLREGFDRRATPPEAAAAKATDWHHRDPARRPPGTVHNLSGPGRPFQWPARAGGPAAFRAG
jgi:hypothetical protein